MLLRARKTFFVGRKPRLGGKAGKAHKAQSVLSEYLFGRRDGAEYPLSNIGNAAQGVDKFFPDRVVINGVCREVAARRVLFNIRCEFDFGRRVQAPNVLIRSETGKFVLDTERVGKAHRARVLIHCVHLKACFAGGGNQLFVLTCARNISIGVLH